MSTQKKNFTFKDDGNSFEYKCWNKFYNNDDEKLKEFIKLYATFWEKRVAPLTNRDKGNNFFKKNTKIKKMDKFKIKDKEVAQFHYSLLPRINMLYDLKSGLFKHKKEKGENQLFIFALTTLRSIIDLTYTFLGLQHNLSKREPFTNNYQNILSEWTKNRQKKQWEKIKEIERIRKYCHAVVHGRPFSGFTKTQETKYPSSPVPITEITCFPTPQSIISCKNKKCFHNNKYLDWATVQHNRHNKQDFLESNKIIKDCWEKLLDYLNYEWQQIVQ